MSANPIDSRESLDLTAAMMEFIKQWAIPGHETAMMHGLIQISCLASQMGAKAAIDGAMKGIKKGIEKGFEKYRGKAQS